MTCSINLKTRLSKRIIYINPCYVREVNKIIKQVIQKKVKNYRLKTRCRSHVRYSAILVCKILCTVQFHFKRMLVYTFVFFDQYNYGNLHWASGKLRFLKTMWNKMSKTPNLYGKKVHTWALVRPNWERRANSYGFNVSLKLCRLPNFSLSYRRADQFFSGCIKRRENKSEKRRWRTGFLIWEDAQDSQPLTLIGGGWGEGEGGASKRVAV